MARQLLRKPAAHGQGIEGAFCDDVTDDHAVERGVHPRPIDHEGVLHSGKKPKCALDLPWINPMSSDRDDPVGPPETLDDATWKRPAEVTGAEYPHALPPRGIGSKALFIVNVPEITLGEVTRSDDDLADLAGACWCTTARHDQLGSVDPRTHWDGIGFRGLHHLVGR